MVEHYLIIIRGKSHAKELSNALETDSAMMSFIFGGGIIYFLMQEKLIQQ